jgi:hypothetical protein
VHTLHGGDHADLREAGDVVRVQVLRVLDAPAEVAPGSGAVDLLVQVQDLAVAAVADGVRVELVAVLQGDLGGAADVVHRLQHQPGAARQVGVRLQQPGAVGAERAVHLALDGAHGEEMVAVAHRAVAGELLAEPFVALALVALRAHAHHGVDANREPPRIGQGAEEIDGGERDARVVEGGDALSKRFRSGQLHHPLGIGGAGLRGARGLVRGDRRAHQPLRRFAQQPGGGALRVAHDLAPRRVGGGGGDPRQLQGGGVREGGVPAGVHQVDRVAGRDGGEGGVHRVPLHARLRHAAPLLLVPPAPRDPGARLRLPRRLGHHGDDVVPARRGGQVEHHLRLPQPHEVAVPLDEAGDGEPPPQVDGPRVRPDVAADLRSAPHRRDAVADDRHRLGLGARVVDGDDAAVEEDQVGRRRSGSAGREGRGAGGCCQRQGDERGARGGRENAFHRESRGGVGMQGTKSGSGEGT